MLVLGFLFIIASPGSSDENRAANQETAEQAQEQTVTAQEWVDVIALTANASRQSETFRLQGGQQRLSYTVTGGDWTICTIYVVEEGRDLTVDGGFPEVMVQGPSEDETLLRKRRGDYYLSVDVANGTCVVAIEERR
jgi:hypothetical protein